MEFDFSLESVGACFARWAGEALRPVAAYGCRSNGADVLVELCVL
jgi:hypothetical protein